MGEKVGGPLTPNSLRGIKHLKNILLIKRSMLFSRNNLEFGLSYEKNWFRNWKGFYWLPVETMKERNLSSLEVTRTFKDEHRLKIKICNSNYFPVQKNQSIQVITHILKKKASKRKFFYLNQAKIPLTLWWNSLFITFTGRAGIYSCWKKDKQRRHDFNHWSHEDNEPNSFITRGYCQRNIGKQWKSGRVWYTTNHCRIIYKCLKKF